MTQGVHVPGCTAPNDVEANPVTQFSSSIFIWFKGWNSGLRAYSGSVYLLTTSLAHSLAFSEIGPWSCISYGSYNLELVILLLQPPKYLNYRCAQPAPLNIICPLPDKDFRHSSGWPNVQLCSPAWPQNEQRLAQRPEDSCNFKANLVNKGHLRPSRAIYS